MDLLNHLIDANGERCIPSTLQLRGRDSLVDQMAEELAQQRSSEVEVELPSSQQDFPGLQSIEDFERENPYDPNAKRPRLILLQRNGSAPGTISDFYLRCQACGIQPNFTITETSPQSFTGKVVVGEQTKETSDCFPNKNAVKEALCKLAIPHLPEPEDKASKKRKAVYTDIPTAQVDAAENWIGLLHGQPPNPLNL